MKKTIILGIIIAFLTLTSITFADSWWDTDWQYRRTITIDNIGESLTDYQVAINVTYDSDMQSDFDDIRFVDSDNSIELNYWMQEKNNPEWAYFWVKIPSIPASSTKTIYMYYGNPSTSSESDIQNTMIIGDDFDDNNFNTTKWLTDANSGTTEESNGILNVTCGFNVDSKRRHYTLEKNITTGILEGRVKIDDIENTIGHQYHALTLSNVVEWWVDVDLTSADFNEGSEAGNYVRYSTRNDGAYSGTNNHNPQDFVENIWVKFKIVLKSNESAAYYKNETLMHNHTTNVPDEPLFVFLTSETGQLSDTSSDFWTAYDWVFIREYASLEPTYLIGIEESTTPIPPEPECNCTELTERVSELEERVETLEQADVPPHTHPISEIIGLQDILDSIQSNLDRLFGLLTELPRGFRQQMVCGYMKTTSTNSLDALGLHCEIKKWCQCKNI